jgi:hypothetical protein
LPPPVIRVPAAPVPGTVNGLVRDAVSGLPLVGASVQGPGGRSASTDANGLYQLGGLPTGSTTLTASAPGHVADTQSVTLAAGGGATLNFALAEPVAAGQFRVVLTWSQTPRDLDAHLWAPPGASALPEVDFLTRGSRGAPPFAQLEIDDTTGLGPETITITQTLPGTYQYAVHNFSNDGPLAGSGARVQVYGAGGLLQQFTPPPQGGGRWWTVFTLTGGSIAPVNRIGPIPPLGTACGFCPPG